MSSNTDWWPLIAIGFLILVPLVPAVLLYKMFEQKTVVTGPFKGLRLDLSGAFAGYFLILLLGSSLFYGPGERSQNYRNEIARLNAQVKQNRDLGTAWTVMGKIVLKGQEHASMQGVEIAILPRPQFRRDGTFEISVVKDVVRDTSGVVVARFPTFEVSQPGYFTETIHLEPMGGKLGRQYSKSTDEAKRIITIDDVIELTKETTP